MIWKVIVYVYKINHLLLKTWIKLGLRLKLLLQCSSKIPLSWAKAPAEIRIRKLHKGNIAESSAATPEQSSISLKLLERNQLMTKQLVHDKKKRAQENNKLIYIKQDTDPDLPTAERSLKTRYVRNCQSKKRIKSLRISFTSKKFTVDAIPTTKRRWTGRL